MTKNFRLDLTLKKGINPEMVESILTDHAEKEGWLEVEQ